MNAVIYFFGSGLAFFAGAGLLLTAVVLATLSRRPRLARLAPVSAAGGGLLVALSATPLPYWYYVTAACVTLTWLIVERRRLWPRGLSPSWVRAAVALVWLAGSACELPYHLVPTIPTRGRPTLWIVGDSVTAGMGDSRIETWPRLLARRHGLLVHDRSQMGATVGSALRHLEKEPLGDGLVLLEIGGNDLLGTTTVTDFEDLLDRLLVEVCRPGRVVVMLELPLPPFCNDYGRAQRRLAAAHGVTLIPKRWLVDVLTANGATVDGIHLSQEGHELMAEKVWRLLKPALRE